MYKYTHVPTILNLSMIVQNYLISDRDFLSNRRSNIRNFTKYFTFSGFLSSYYVVQPLRAFDGSGRLLS